MNIKRRIVLASLAFLILETNPASGADKTWTGNHAHWKSDKPNNWNPTGVPGTGDTAVFATGGTSNQPDLRGDTSVLGVLFSGTGWSISSGGAGGSTLTVGAGGIDQTGSGVNTVAVAVALNGASTWTVSSGTLAVSGTVSGASALTKDGAGTLLLSAANSYSGGTIIEAGTLQFSTGANRLSTTGSIAMKGGTLNLGGFGQTTSGSVTFAGGSLSNGTLTKSGGNFNAESGSVAANGILAGDGVGFQKTTGSSFTLNGNHTYNGATAVNEGTLIVNGSIQSEVVVALGANLGGHGTVLKISGAGTVSPGESPAILTTSSVDASLGLDFHFEFTNEVVAGISTPDFLTPGNSGNDLLRITDATPFNSPLTTGNVVTVDFSQVTLSIGDRYLGGFYTQDYSYESFSGANFQYLGLEGYSVTVSMIEWNTTFSGGPVSGFITQFEVIPEPSTVALLTLSSLGMAAVLRRRRRFNSV